MGIRPGERVLDIGVGTGLALANYPSHAEIVGIDLSDGMLRHARRRVRQGGMDWVQLCVANALELPFPAESFDHVMLSHVITVVSDPVRLVEETRRVTRPGGQIVIINHFRPATGVLPYREVRCPLCHFLGWRAIFRARMVDHTRLCVDYLYKLDQVDLWEYVFITNKPAPAAEQQQSQPLDRAPAPVSAATSSRWKGGGHVAGVLGFLR